MEMNYAEVQHRYNNGQQTLDECKRMGSTHAAYGWSANNPTGGHAWSAEQWAAYKEGFNNV